MLAEALDLIACKCDGDAVDERQLARDVAADAVDGGSRSGESRAFDDESSGDRMARGFEWRRRFAFRSGHRRARRDQAREARDAHQGKQAGKAEQAW